jgi:ribosomal-protein-alanine N-acetyltransferase
MEIRKGKLKDIKSFKKIDNASLKAKHSTDYFLKNLDKIIVAVDYGQVLGYIMFKENEISNLVVDPEFRKKGIGKILVREVKKKSKRLVLRTREENKDARIFFKKLGFVDKRTIENYYSNGDNAIEMKWIKK